MSDSVKRAKFVAAARREFLAEVVYFNKEEPGLGARFSAAVMALSNERSPEFDTILKVTRALGIKLHAGLAAE